MHNNLQHVCTPIVIQVNRVNFIVFSFDYICGEPLPARNTASVVVLLFQDFNFHGGPFKPFQHFQLQKILKSITGAPGDVPDR